LILLPKQKNPGDVLEMSKFQINDVKLDGAELFNDSETFFDELEDSELDQIVGGLDKTFRDFSQLEIDLSSLSKFLEEGIETNSYISNNPFVYEIFGTNFQEQSRSYLVQTTTVFH